MTRGRARRHAAMLTAGVTIALAAGSREIAIGVVLAYLIDVGRDAWREANSRVDADLAELEETPRRE